MFELYTFCAFLRDERPRPTLVFSRTLVSAAVARAGRSAVALGATRAREVREASALRRAARIAEDVVSTSVTGELVGRYARSK